MDSFLSTEVLAGVLVGLMVLVVGLIIIQVWSSLQIRRMSKTSYQDNVDVARNQAANIVAEAQVEAQGVLAEANETGARAMAEAGKEARKTNESYQAELRKLVDLYHQELDATIKRGDKSFAVLTSSAADSFNRRQDELNNQFDDVLEALSTVAGTLNSQTVGAMKALESSIDESTKTLEKMLQEGELVVKQRVEEHLEKLLDRAESDVDEYKKARVTLLDSHIERLIEDITVRVLHKKLTLEEHGDLAQQALKDAKEHNVL